MSAPHDAEPAPSSGDVRRRRLLALLDDDPSAPPSPPRGPPGIRARLQRLCVISVFEVGVDGAGVTVMGGADAALVGHRDQVGATGSLTPYLEDLQLTAGEGPCLDAYTSGAPVLAPDMAIESTRWIGFAPEALAAGAAAMFSLPLQVGAVRLGTLDLYRGTAGGLTRVQLADALTLAALATETLLELAAVVDPSDDSGEGPATDREQGPTPGWLPDVHAGVHIASGMVSVRLGIDVGAALLRIRAHAFTTGEPIADVARRIVDRALVLGEAADPAPTDPDGPLGLNPSSEDDD